MLRRYTDFIQTYTIYLPTLGKHQILLAGRHIESIMESKIHTKEALLYTNDVNCIKKYNRFIQIRTHSKGSSGLSSRKSGRRK